MRANIYALRLNEINFFFQRNGINYHTVAHNVYGIVSENSGGNGMQHHTLAVKLQRMTGIRAALEASHYIIARRKYVNNFSFTLVTPLETEQNINRHFLKLKINN